MVTVRFSKRDFVWIGLVIVLVGVGLVVASNTDWKASISSAPDAQTRESSALVHGHTPDEILITIPTRPSTYVSTTPGEIWLCSGAGC